MYGPNYVKLTRAFAVQLFTIFIGHYAALIPARSGPYWPRSHAVQDAITASIRLAFTHTLGATPAARDPNLDSGNHDMSRLSALTYPNDERCADPRPRRHTPSPLPTDIGCGTSTSPLALDKTRQHTLLASQTSTVATTTCLDYLHPLTRTMRRSTASPTHV
jgi:hypothetical protein